MVGITEVSAIFASAGVIVGVALTVLEIRNLVRQRQTDLIMRLYSRFGSEGFQKIFEKVVLSRETLSLHQIEEKYGLAGWVAIITFFEGIGVLLYRKLIDIRLVDDLFTSPINMTWDKMKDSIAEARKEYEQPTICEWFEYLYNEMKKRKETLQQKT
jgi:hypothetical protein